VLKLEPYVSSDVIAGLYSSDAGNLIPYEFAIALMENAVDNGVELRTRRHVTEIKENNGLFSVTARHWEPAAFVEHTLTTSSSTTSSKNKLCFCTLINHIH
jgi:L-2-hydroxyglutarate oxidase LhgO